METGVPKPQPIDTPVADSAQVRGLPEEKDASAFVASQWKLMWWRFRKHRLAMISGVIIIFMT